MGCIELNGKMHSNFEQERRVLATFRDELQALMDRKTKRISELESQAAKVNKVINDAGHDPLGPVATAFQAHDAAVHGVCPELSMGAADAKAIAALATQLDSGAAIAVPGTDAPRVDQVPVK